MDSYTRPDFKNSALITIDIMRDTLEGHLKRIGVNTLVFAGCNFPNCPRTSIYEASERDYKIALAENAVSGLYEQGKKELVNIGVLVESTNTIMGLAGA